MRGGLKRVKLRENRDYKRNSRRNGATGVDSTQFTGREEKNLSRKILDKGHYRKGHGNGKNKICKEIFGWRKENFRSGM